MKTTSEKLQRHYDKQRENARRQIERQRARQADPEWRAEQYAKQRERNLKRFNRAKSKPLSRGIKGRTPNAEEKRMMEKIGALPCIACYVHGVITEITSLHHIDGRTAPGAHMRLLSLCDGHHQHAAPDEVRARYPWLVPVHADGRHGGKAAFEALNGSQSDLYALTLEMIA